MRGASKVWGALAIVGARAVLSLKVFGEQFGLDGRQSRSELQRH